MSFWICRRDLWKSLHIITGIFHVLFCSALEGNALEMVNLTDKLKWKKKICPELRVWNCLSLVQWYENPLPPSTHQKLPILPSWQAISFPLSLSLSLSTSLRCLISQLEENLWHKSKDPRLTLIHMLFGHTSPEGFAPKLL